MRPLLYDLETRQLAITSEPFFQSSRPRPVIATTSILTQRVQNSGAPLLNKGVRYGTSVLPPYLLQRPHAEALRAILTAWVATAHIGGS